MSDNTEKAIGKFAKAGEDIVKEIIGLAILIIGVPTIITFFAALFLV